MYLREGNPSQEDLLTDMDILKSFNMPVLNDEQIFEGSYVSKMLKERDKRPTRNTWILFLKTAEDCGLNATDAAELYFHYLEKQENPFMPTDEAPPNIVGSSIDGLGLSADEDKKKKDCD